MPLLMVHTNKSHNLDDAQSFIGKASRTVSELLGKSENYVMVCLQPPSPMSFAGSSDPTACLELKSIGLPETATVGMSEALCNLVNSELGIAKDRIFIEFASPERHMWGWNGATF